MNRKEDPSPDPLDRIHGRLMTGLMWWGAMVTGLAALVLVASEGALATKAASGVLAVVCGLLVWAALTRRDR